MIYRLKELKGDTIAVPQLIFSKLGIAEEYNVRVALYVLATGITDPDKICADLNVGYDYDLFTVGSRVPDSNAALSVKCGKNAMALAKTSSSGSAIQIRPLESGINGYDVFITGFWFA